MDLHLSTMQFPLLLAQLLLLTCSTCFAKESYTTNSVCRQNKCIDPIFPALPAMSQLEAKSFECQKPMSRKLLKFCFGQVTYDFAVAKPEGDESTKITDIVKAIEQEAVTYYAYHLAGMGYEYEENMEPTVGMDDSCIESVWRQTCFTFFPQCNQLAPGKYMRPCRSSCENYLRECKVECCDESVSCVFEHHIKLVDGTQQKSSAYVDHNGPSTKCTGSAMRNGSILPLLAAALLFYA